ncbi:MAG: hypothetical protein E7526_01120 [Ruminococcaceae bacterium]|nr:hypothetical protein [Oscillospiraceae bacterium]
MSVQVKEWSLYILNPDCELGSIGSKSSLYETYGSVGPLTYGYPGCKCKIKVYGLKDSPIKEYVNEYMVDKMGTVTARFIGIEQDKIDELQAQCEERGITKPTANTMGDDGSVNTGNGGNNTNNTTSGNSSNGDNNGAATNNGGDSGLLQTIIIAATVLIVILIIAVVVIVVTSKSKKKKKKKKKAKNVEETVDEVVEETTEEKGEEE